MGSYDFPFSDVALDEGTASKALPWNRFKRLENLRMTKDNMVRKRKGTRQIPGNAVTKTDSDERDPAGPIRLFTHQDQLIVCGERAMWAYSPAEDQLEYLQTLTSVTLQRRESLGHYGSRDVEACGVARVTDFTVWAWVTSNPASAEYNIHALTVDNTTGSGTAATLVYTGTSAVLRTLKVIAIDDTKVSIFWGEGNPDSIYYVDITSANSGPYVSVSPTELVSDDCDRTSEQWFDVTPHDSGYLLAYADKSSGGGVTVNRYDSSHVQQATANVSFSGADPRIQICGDMEADASVTCAVVIASTTNIKVAELNDALSVQGSPYDVTYSGSAAWDDAGVEGIAACTFPDVTGATAGVALVANVEDSAGSKFLRVYLVSGNAITGNRASEEHANAYVNTKPWVYDYKIYFGARYYTSQPNSHQAILRFDPEIASQSPGWSIIVPEMRVLPGQVPTTEKYDVASCVAHNGQDVWLPFRMVDRFSGPDILEDPTSANVVTVVGVDGYHVRLYDRSRFEHAKVGGYTYLSGATNLTFDGRRAYETSFWAYPEFSTSDLTAGSGGSMDAGSYLYALVWEFPDNQSSRHQSAYEIIPVTIPTEDDGSGDVTITLPQEMTQTLKFWRTFGSDARPISLAIYRSENNATIDTTTGQISYTDGTAGAPSLFRLEGAGVSAFAESTRGTTTASLGDWVDTYDTASIQLTSREKIYGPGGLGELQNVPPPPSNILIEHDNRLWGIDASNPSVGWYTKQWFPGTALAWNETLTVQFPEEIFALAKQDGNLIAFSTGGSIYTVRGRPADNTGASVGYEPPQLLSTERTCTNRRSIVSCPIGILYESSRGIELLGRGGVKPEWIGKPVRDTLASYPIITDSLHVEADSEVLFSCVDSLTPVGSEGVVLAYNYDREMWFVRQYRTNRPVSAMCLFQGKVVFGIYDSPTQLKLYWEDDGFDDSTGAYIPWVLETSALTCGRQGLRFNHIGRMHSLSHLLIQMECFGGETVQVEESTDDGTTYDDPVTYDIKTSEAGGANRVYYTQQRKARAHNIRLSGVATGSTTDTEGVGLYGLVLEGQPLAGQLLLPRSMEG